MPASGNDRIEQALVRHLTAAGISCTPEPCPPEHSSGSADAVGITIGGQHFITRQRSLPDVPERILEVLSLHVLRTGTGTGTGTGTDNAPPGLMIVTVPRLPRSKSNWTAELREAQRHVQSPAAWAILSRQGGCLISLPPCGDRFIARDDQHDIRAEKPSRAREPRSDVALAVLKSIMIKGVAETLPTSGGNHRLQESATTWETETIADLAQRLGISKAGAYGAIGDLIQHGWMKSRRGKIPSISNLSAIVTWWIDRRRHRLLRTFPVAPLYEAFAPGDPRVLAWLGEKYSPAENSWAISGWTACALHKRLAINDISDKPIVVSLAGPIRDMVTNWSLREVPAGEAMFHFQRSPHPLTTFSCISVIRGLPVVDPWEAALDVVGDPQRGPEQAAAIADALFALT